MTTPDTSDLRYCESRYQTRRRVSRAINVGGVSVGGDHPIRVQSMTTTHTQDVDATVAQTLALAEAGCEIVRITAPNKAAAAALGEISKKVRAAKCKVPLVADIHFLPAAAMEAAKHVEKVRINPGNYADKKKFAVLEYSDAAYEEELERLHEAFSPIVLRCKELGRAMRIGTNHGSLSDRIMNRYGDTPLGMVECALEFIRIAESHNYHDICLSMKARYNSYAQRGNMPMIQHVLTGGLAVFPNFSRLKMLRTWGGIMDMSMDGSPIIDKTHIDGVYLNCGWCYGGFKATPCSGWVFAHTIAKNEVHELNAEFNLERFHTGRIIDEKGVGPKPWIG